ncbi:YesL family protein, partial [Mycobacterium tuberculosis]|nr:YesL family protein [Mycobacterium tuberculosis]
VSLAVVTIPAAQAAATSVAVDMVEDRNSYLGRDFWDSFRREFWRASLGGWLILAGQAIALYAIYVYAQAVAVSPVFALPTVVSAAGF